MIKRISRRGLTSSMTWAVGAVAVSGKIVWAQKKAPSSVVAGVQLGVQSYSFRDRPLDQAIDAMIEVGINSCELWQGDMEPQNLDREALRKWRLDTPLTVYAEASQKLKNAGIQLSAYNYSFKKDMTDEELERGFQMAKALGTSVVTASSNPSIAGRIDAYAKKFKVRVGMHNHAQGGRPDEFDGPKEFALAMEGASPFICINLDIGHFVAAGFDPVEYLDKHHERIVTLHIKDRQKGLGPQSPTVKFGTGGTPIKAVLQLLKTKKYRIPANIEHEIKGQPAVEGVRESLEFCKRALA